jgi:hypothetical protein
MQHISTAQNRKLRASSRQRQQSKERKLARKQTESWKEESGMGTGRKADALGDGDDEGTSGIDDAGSKLKAATLADDESPNAKDGAEQESILREALKGNMQVEQGKEEAVTQGEESIGQKEIEKLKEEEGTVQEQVY